jgi:L-lysine 2,3-aminomutase
MDDPSPRIAELFGVAQDSPEWNDWHWQYQHRVRDAEGLSRVLELSEAERGESENVSNASAWPPRPIICL